MKKSNAQHYQKALEICYKKMDDLSAQGKMIGKWNDNPEIIKTIKKAARTMAENSTKKQTRGKHAK